MNVRNRRKYGIADIARQAYTVHRKRVMAFVLFSFIALTAISLAGTLETSVPLTIEKGVLFMHARVDGSEPMLFVFDPGADSYVTRYAAPQLTARPSHTVNVGGISITEPLPVIDGDPQQLDPSHNAALGTIAGTIGRELLRRFVVRIDYAHGTLALISPATFHAGSRNALPLHMDRYGIPTVPATVNGVAGTFELDVRAPSSMLFTPFAHSLGFQVPQQTKRRLDSVRIGTYVQTGVAAWISNAQSGKFASSEPQGLIGNDVLWHYVVTLDYSRGLAYLQ